MSSTVADDFAARMLSVINSGMLSLMLSVGHRTRLFDVMPALPPWTSSEIVMAAGLEERYVREWLGAMTIGRVVEHDPAAMTFSSPAEHAPHSLGLTAPTISPAWLNVKERRPKWRTA